MDSDFGVVDLDGVDDGAEVGAAGFDGTVFEVLAHELDEGGDLYLREPSLGREFREGGRREGSRARRVVNNRVAIGARRSA
jgi:hypothetical protein